MFDVKRWNRNSICLFLAVIIAGCTLLHVLLITTGVPLADEWRWMKDLLIPYIHGEISFWTYLTGEYALFSHTHYLTLLFMLASYLWWNLNFALMAYVGAAALLAGWLMLWLYMKRIQDRQGGEKNYWLLLILTAAYFSPLSDFPWSLVVFEYLFYFMALALLCAYDAYLYGRLKLVSFLLFLALVLLLADTPGIMAALAVFSWSCVLVLFRRERWWTVLGIVLVIAVFFIIHYLVLGKGIGGNQPLSSSLSAIFQHPAAIVLSVIMAFAQGLWAKYLLVGIVGESAVVAQYLLGCVGIMLVIASLAIFIRRGGGAVTQLPFLLVTFSMVAWWTILLSRYLDAGVDIFNAPRFVRYFTPLYLGVAVALIFASGRKARLYTACVVVFFCTIYAVAISVEYNRKKYVLAFFDNAKTELVRDEIDLDALTKTIFRCRNGFCDQSIEFMKERRLSVFADKD